MNDNNNIKAQASTFDSLVEIAKENDESLNNLCLEAKSYLLRHTWCKDILCGWLAVYWEGVIGVFLFEIKPAVSGVDKYVWIVVGDIPPAYIDVESGEDPQGVLESYVAIMRDWADTVLEGESVEDCYPLEVPPTKEYAEMLQTRLDFLDKFISEEM